MERLVNIKEIVQQLDLSPAAAKRLIDSVPAVKTGRKRLVRREDLIEYICNGISPDVKQFAEVILSGN